MDVASLVDAEMRRLAPAPLPPLPGPPPGLPARTQSVPPIPARALPGAPRESARAIRDRLDAEVRRAQDALTARLREVYAAEIRAERFARDREIEDLRRAGLADVVAGIRARFEALARERAPLAARLALLAGFPDPGPKAPLVETEASERRLKEANALRARLAALDAAFDAYVANLQRDAEAGLAQKIRAVGDELAARRRELDARAATEARGQIRSLSRALDLRLGGLPATRLASVPGRTTTLPATPALVAPTVKGRGGVPSGASPPTAPVFRRAEVARRIETELRIWSGLERVAVVAPGPGVRDATGRFSRWRREAQ